MVWITLKDLFGDPLFLILCKIRYFILHHNIEKGDKYGSNQRWKIWETR